MRTQTHHPVVVSMCIAVSSVPVDSESELDAIDEKGLMYASYSLASTSARRSEAKDASSFKRILAYCLGSTLKSSVVLPLPRKIGPMTCP